MQFVKKETKKKQDNPTCLKPTRLRGRERDAFRHANPEFSQSHFVTSDPLKNFTFLAPKRIKKSSKPAQNQEQNSARNLPSSSA